MINAQDLSLEAIGLNKRARTALFLITLLPFVGFVIGINYSFRRNAATRQLGRRLVGFAIVIHGIYAFCICPTLMVWALSR